MYAVATFLVVAVITMVFGQFATGALIATGVPPEIAAFQARSVFSGAGFTTTEAENVVNHPTRRRIFSRLAAVTATMSVMTGADPSAPAPPDHPRPWSPRTPPGPGYSRAARTALQAPHAVTARTPQWSGADRPPTSSPGSTAVRCPLR